jgi:hypothetical protein
MSDEFLKDRTFQLYYFHREAFPDFAVQMQCGGNHHRTAFDFRALRIEEDVLRPILLRFKDQNFRAVATEWELANSVILNADGVTPIVDDEGVVVGHLGDKDPIATYMRPIVDVDGNVVMEFWDETPLAPSVPFEVGTAVAGGFGARAGAKAAVRKALTMAPTLVRLRAALKGSLLKTLLRKRIVPKNLPNISEGFRFGPHSGTEPNFWGMVNTRDNNVICRITNQVMHVPKHPPMSAQKLQQLVAAEAAAAKERVRALRYAAEQAKLHGRPTFIMRIEQANQGSREGAEKLLRKLGQPPTPSLETPLPGGNPTLEYVLQTDKVLEIVH